MQYYALGTGRCKPLNQMIWVYLFIETGLIDYLELPFLLSSWKWHILQNQYCFAKDVDDFVIETLIKRPQLDPSELANYRPISNLPFMSNILEKVESAQLCFFL